MNARKRNKGPNRIEFQNREGSPNANEVSDGGCWRGSASDDDATVGASRVSGGVRQGQASPSGWNGHRDGIDQSALLDSCRREKPRWHRHQLDGGMRQPQHHAAARVHQAVSRSGYRACYPGISGQKRAEQSQWQQRDIQRRQEVVCRRIESGYSGRSAKEAATERRTRMKYSVFASLLVAALSSLPAAAQGPA